MKRFHQYILEDFPALANDIGKLSSPSQDIQSYVKPQHIGSHKVGDTVFDFHTYSVFDGLQQKFVPHRGGLITVRSESKTPKIVGAVQFDENSHDEIGTAYSPDTPRLHPDYRKKGLMSELYKKWSSHTGNTIRSGSFQSKGGQNVWKELGKSGKVKVFDQTGEKQGSVQYDPTNEQHNRVFFSNSRLNFYYKA